MSVGHEEQVVSKKQTVSTRVAADLVSMANVVASIEGKAAVDVIDELLRSPLAKRYKLALAKAAKEAEKDEGSK